MRTVPRCARAAAAVPLMATAPTWDSAHPTRGARARVGKIVLYNPPWVSYGVNNIYRFEGATRAEGYGAVASLIRSVAPYSLATPHTGSMDTAGIPGAALTHEDADIIERLVRRGVPVQIKLYMEAQFLPDAPSRNIIAEVAGSEFPNEVVVFGGHIDSWDVGVGALDDGGGAFVAWEALRLMAKYNIRPRRTVRAVFWTVRRPGPGRRAAPRTRRRQRAMLTGGVRAWRDGFGACAARTRRTARAAHN